MFTGIIETKGKIESIEEKSGDARFYINTATLDLTDVSVGDSICVNGVCLTATELTDSGFWTDVSGETLSRTTLANMKIGDVLNIEKSMLPTTRMGGHLVSGHVDGVAVIVKIFDDGRSVKFQIKVPDALAKYIAEKGSICVDGVSLTVNAVAAAVFDINIIPHTLNETIIGEYIVGQHVNIEVDIVARYLERLLLDDSVNSAAGSMSSQSSQNITMELLKEHGFAK